METNKGRTLPSKEELKKINEEYTTITDDDDDEMVYLKERIMKLDAADRLILLLYAEEQSQRAVGEMFNVSHSTILKELRRIRKEILED